MADFPAQNLTAGATIPFEGNGAPSNAQALAWGYTPVYHGITNTIQGQSLASFEFDYVEPQITNLSPAPGSVIYPWTTVSFDVTDETGILFLEIQADHGTREVIHDGDAFVYPYTTSSRVPVENGWRYQVRRTGGWKTSPRFLVRAFDTAGNEG